MDQEPPKIEFPCDYPIKIIGDGQPDFKDLVLRTILPWAPDLDYSTVSVQPSREGTFSSVRVTITATGEDQLRHLHEALKATGRVKMVI